MKKRLLTITLAATLLLGVPLTVSAAPKTMPDGQTFDAEFYAKNYPDVKAAIGTDEAALYKHYKDYGKAEGRLPYADAQPATVKTEEGTVDVNYWTDYEELGNGKYLQHPLQYEVLTPGAEIYDTQIIAMAKDLAPTGTEWGDETYYDTVSSVKGRNIAKRGQGCQAFAYWLTDAIYGKTPMVRYENTDANPTALKGFAICQYDIVHYVTSTGEFHCGVVMGADPKTNTLYLAESNVNGKVDWNRSIKTDDSDGNLIARIYRREAK